MTETILLEKVKEWTDKHHIQFDRLSTTSAVKLANGTETYAANEASYAAFSKKEESYKTLIFSYRSLIVFSYENSIITGEEASVLEPAFIIPPPRTKLD